MAFASTTSLMERFKKEWVGVDPATGPEWTADMVLSPEQYAKKKGVMAAQPHLFDSHLGAGHWITIGAERKEGGDHHGGHHVFVGKDGEMKTGKFAGQTMEQAFGSQPKKGASVAHSVGKPKQGSLFDDAFDAFASSMQRPKPDYDQRLKAMQERKDPDKILAVKEPGDPTGQPISQQTLRDAATQPDPDSLKQRLRELNDQRDAINEQINPLYQAQVEHERKLRDLYEKLREGHHEDDKKDCRNGDISPRKKMTNMLYGGGVTNSSCPR
jgi:hypothetical protein